MADLVARESRLEALRHPGMYYETVSARLGSSACIVAGTNYLASCVGKSPNMIPLRDISGRPSGACPAISAAMFTMELGGIPAGWLGDLIYCDYRSAMMHGVGRLRITFTGNLGLGVASFVICSRSRRQAHSLRGRFHKTDARILFPAAIRFGNFASATYPSWEKPFFIGGCLVRMARLLAWGDADHNHQCCSRRSSWAFRV